MLRLHALATLDQFRQVERLEGEIWGPVDLVPLPILAVSVRRGAVLIGAFEGDRLVGFVYSFPALRPSKDHAPHGDSGGAPSPPSPSHWSHMLGVHPDCRGAGLGRDLKLAQRNQVLALGLDLIEWTYDPLQALNAHLNFAKLGVIAEEYAENVYGESPSPLHGGLPTDRLVCQWWIRRPHVARRIQPVGKTLVSHDVADAPVVNDTRLDGEWLECLGVDTSQTGPRLAADIPLEFTAMLAREPARAARWRYHARAVFTSYLAAGYRVVDFGLDRIHQRGRYLLTNIPPPTSGDP
jgi:chorismate synthase